MKNLILIIILICLTNSASAQRVEIFGGYSYGSEVGSIPSFNPPYITMIDRYANVFSGHDGKSAMTLGINVRILGNVSLGLSWTGLNSGSKSYGALNTDNPDCVKQNTNAILFGVKYDWLKIWKLNIYSRAGVGAVFIGKPKIENEDESWYEWRDGKPESCKRFAWQVSYLGVEFRPIRYLGVFAEGGLGRQGALLAGLKVFL